MRENETPWSMRSIGELLKRVVRPVNLERTGTYREIGIRSHCKGIFHKTEVSGDQIGTKRVFWIEPGCLVFNIVFAWEQAVAITSDEEKGMIASHRFPMYDSRNGELRPDYAFLYFSSPRGKYDLNIASPGGAGRNKTLGQEEFLRLKIPVPPIGYQRMTVEAITAWDRAIERTEKLIAAKRRLKKGLAQQLLTGERRLPGFDSEWKSVRLSDIAILKMGSSPPSSAYNDQGNGMPLIQGNADTHRRRSTPRSWTSVVTTTCDIGDTLMSVRAPIGDVSISEHNACIGRGMCVLRARGIFSQKYLYQALLRLEPDWLHLGQGSTFTAINSNDIRNLRMDVPTNQYEQKQIAGILNATDSEITLLEKKLSALREQKRGLMQKLLTGQVSFKA